MPLDEQLDVLRRCFGSKIQSNHHINGEIFYIEGLTRAAAFEAARCITEECYAQRLVPCVMAMTSPFAPGEKNPPAQLTFQFPPDPQARGFNPASISFPGEIFYSPPRECSLNDLHVGSETQYLQIISLNSRQLAQIIRDGKHPGRKSGLSNT